jgi:uncharacterized membrane protein YphA (DoxX/SURF4 family)
MEPIMIDQRTAPYAALILRTALGAMFIAGVFSRWVSAGLVPVLLGAFLAAVAVAQMLLGDGRYALANRLLRRNLIPVPA